MAATIDLEELLIAGGDPPPVRADLRSPAPDTVLPLVIVTHGFLGYKRWGFFPWLSERIARAGFHVLTISFSMNGVDERTGRIARSEEFARNTVRREIADLEGVFGHVRRGLLPRSIAGAGWGLVAHSRGAAVAMLAAKRAPEIRSLVTWATPSRLDRYSNRRKKLWKKEGALVFHDARADGELRLDYSYYEDIDMNRDAYDLPSAAAAIRIPHLLVHGERDAAVTVREMMMLYPDGAPPNARCEIVSGCSHTFGASHPMRKVPKTLEQAVSLTEDWLTETLHGTEWEDSR